MTTMLPTEDAPLVGEELTRRFGLPIWQFALTATDANRFALRLARQITERSVVRLSAPQAARKLEHWRAIAVSACEQSGRNRLPKVLSPLPLADFLRQSGSGPRLLLSPTGSTRIQDVPTPVSSVTVLIGPEGGLADAEQSAALAAGFTAVRLGPRILRTETAAIAALTVLQREFGDL